MSSRATARRDAALRQRGALYARVGGLATTLLLAGCSSSPQVSGAHGTLWLSTADAPLGLSRIQPVQEFSFYLPASRQEASAEFARDGAIGVMGSEATFIFPATALLGGIIGAGLGLDEADRAQAVTAISAATRDAAVEEELARRLGEHLGGPGRLRELPPNLPVEPPETPGRLVREKSGRMVWARASTPPHPAAGAEVQTLIHLHLWRQGLDAVMPLGSYSGDAANPNPALTLVLSVEVVAIRVRDWSVVGGITSVYRSQPHKFTAWAADDAALLRRELNAGLEDLWLQLTREIIVERGPSPAPAGRDAQSTGDRPTTSPTAPP